MRRGLALNQLKGFTLIELLVSITLISLLVTFGISAYSKSQRYQELKAASDALISRLEYTHKNALVGKKESDCIGAFKGYKVTTLALSGQLTITPLCSIVDGTESIITLDNITFEASQNFTFTPLSGGVSFESGNSLDLDYTNLNGETERLTITATGNLEYQGVIN